MRAIIRLLEEVQAVQNFNMYIGDVSMCYIVRR